MAIVVAVLNALLPPILAALRLPFMLALGFLLVLAMNAFVLPSRRRHPRQLHGRLLLVGAARRVDRGRGHHGPRGRLLDQRRPDVLAARHPARRAPAGGSTPTDVPGIVFPRSTGWRSRSSGARCATATRRTWPAGSEDTHRMLEWEPDLSSQTGASQAGILLGSNEDIPAFRWVEKETGTMMTCSAPDDCARIERDRATGIGLLVDGGASRGNLLSGEAEEVILTVSRIEAEKRANPGYRAFFANGFNVTRALVLFGWEVILEWGGGPRKAARRPPTWASGRPVSVHARGDVRDRSRPDRLRRAHGHDAGARRSTQRSRATTRSRTTRASSGPTRSRRCASWTNSSAGSSAPLRAASVRARRPSTMARRRERRSSSGTATASTTS